MDIILPIYKRIRLAPTKKIVAERILSMAEKIIEWTIVRGELARENVDDFADVVEVCIESIDKEKGMYAIEMCIL